VWTPSEIGERLGRQRPRLELLVQHRERLDAFDREGAHLLVFLHPGDQVDPALRVREPQRIGGVVFRVSGRGGVVSHPDPPLAQRRVNRARQDLARLLLVCFFRPVDFALSIVGKRLRNFRLAAGNAFSSFMNARFTSSRPRPPAFGF
jgi:hypothetical protein